jgi:uncharacterized protein with HEPN domain
MTGDKLYLTHILESIERIQSYIIDGKDKFEKDSMVQDAVLRNLHTLAESSTRISPELTRLFTDVPWKEMRAFRHVVVHDYLGLELDQIWEIVIVNIPPLKESVQKILQSFP